MKILLFSVLLALAAADPIPGASKPGMCFEEYFKLHPEAFAKVKEKVVKSIEGGADADGSKESWHLMDFSKLSRCSADGECKDADKCCRTMCGMRCIKPILEHHSIDDIRSNVPNPDAANGDAENALRQKRDADEGDEKSNDEKNGGEAEEDQSEEKESSQDKAGVQTEKDQGNGREKRSVDEGGRGRGRGHGGRGGHGGQGGKGKGKGEGRGKDHEEEEESGKRGGKGRGRGGRQRGGKAGRHEHEE